MHLLSLGCPLRLRNEELVKPRSVPAVRMWAVLQHPGCPAHPRARSARPAGGYREPAQVQRVWGAAAELVDEPQREAPGYVGGGRRDGERWT
jgi:hypothetical protein